MGARRRDQLRALHNGSSLFARFFGTYLESPSSMVLLYLPFTILLIATAFALLSARGRAPLWVAVLLLCIAALTSALPVPTTTIR